MNFNPAAAAGQQPAIQHRVNTVGPRPGQQHFQQQHHVLHGPQSTMAGNVMANIGGNQRPTMPHAASFQNSVAATAPFTGAISTTGGVGAHGSMAAIHAHTGQHTQQLQQLAHQTLYHHTASGPVGQGPAAAVATGQSAVQPGGVGSSGTVGGQISLPQPPPFPAKATTPQEVVAEAIVPAIPGPLLEAESSKARIKAVALALDSSVEVSDDAAQVSPSSST